MREHVQYMQEHPEDMWLGEHDLFEPMDTPYLTEHRAALRVNFRRRIDLVEWDATHASLPAPGQTGPLIYPFNSYRNTVAVHPDGFVEFDKRPENIAYNELWTAMAWDIFGQVERGLHMEELDWNNPMEVGQAYADFFRVHIHIYQLLGEGYRTQTFIPAWGEQLGRHVHLLEDDCHIYPITNVRSFFANTGGSGKMSHHNFCDYCGYATSDSVNREKMEEHVRKCMTTNGACKPHAQQQLESDYVLHKIPMKLEYYKHCTDCNLTKRKLGIECMERHHIEKVTLVICQTCKVEMPLDPHLNGTHVCYMEPPKETDAVVDENIWVYDIESMQQTCRDVGGMEQRDAYMHTCILVCLQNVYSGERWQSTSMDEFCDYIYTDPKFSKAVILAHNGGGYDHQEVLRYCERRQITYHTIPHPSSQHKFLSLEFKPPGQDSRRFIDFMAFVSGGLKQIGQDFGLGVVKGDFPHNFSRPENLHYIGKIPPLHSPEDYFGYHGKRSRAIQLELEEWHASERARLCACPVIHDGGIAQPVCAVCRKPNWVFQDELIKYCWLDVEVLAQSCKRYREAIQSAGTDSEFGWNYKGIDPFAMITQGQVAMHTFLQGHQDLPNLVSSQYNVRCDLHPWSNAWLKDIQQRLPQYSDILYLGNSIREFFFVPTQQFYAGYSARSKTLFQFRPCAYHACARCHPVRDDEIHPTRRMTGKDIRLAVMEEELQIARNHYTLQVMWECQFQPFVQQYEATINRDAKVISPREYFFGGHTEVYRPFAQETATHTINYHDVCSLYPFVCACEEMPIGMPEVIHFTQPDDFVYDPQRWWGFVKCLVIPPTHCKLGLLPSKDVASGRLEFTLFEKVGTWHTCELALAVENGYVVSQVYQVYHWSPEKRSTNLMRGYISYWLRQKQESDGWMKAGCASETPSEAEMEAAIESMFQANGGIARMRKEKVAKNPVQRQIAKIFLNCLWGKFAQDNPKTYFLKVASQNDLCNFLSNRKVDLASLRIRHLGGAILKIEYGLLGGTDGYNPRYNLWIAASVTAFARTTLHKRMLEVGPQNVHYCDTDSLLFWNAKDPAHRILPGKGLGKWVDEYPSKKIMKLYALAPKSYNLVFEDGKESMKTKGVSLTMANQSKVTFQHLDNMLRHLFSSLPIPTIKLDHMSITANSQYTSLPYATLLTFYTEKILQPVVSKRQIVPKLGLMRVNSLEEAEVDCLDTVPKGYHFAL